MIRQLYPNQQVWRKWRKIAYSTPDPVGVLRAIGETGEAGAIPRLLGLSLAKEPEVAEAASTAVERLFACVRQDELPRLDYLVRQVSPYLSPSGAWYDLEPLEIGLLTISGDPIVMLGLATMHPNGYMRQPALERLDGISDARVLPFLLLRLNDWVEPVREVAMRAVERRLTPDCAQAWISCLPLALQLAEHRHTTHHDLLDRVLSLLKEPASRPALSEGLSSPYRVVRRTCYRVMLEASEEDQQGVVEMALSDEDPVLRTWAAERMGAHLEPEKLHAWLPYLERDPWVPVRRAAIQLHAERWPDESEELLRRALFDSAQGIRDTARNHLRRAGVTDFRSIYRDALSASSPRLLYAAVLSLGEVGKPDDGGFVSPFLSHPVPKVRRAAVLTLGHLEGDRYTSQFLDALADSNPSVSRAAMEVLRRKGQQIEPQTIWAIFEATPFYHVRRHVMSLLLRSGRWRSIPFLVRASTHPDRATAERARWEIERWLSVLNTGYVKPTPQQLHTLSTALDESGGDDYALRSIIRYWSRLSV